MARRRSGRKLARSLLPIISIVVLAVVGALAWIVHGVTRPPRQPYVVTPQSFTQISAAVLKATDETWANRDGTRARGWLLRGAEGAPAVILLHRYGADRSWLFNLGVKLHESRANFTILWPDLRGHGENPLVKWTSFGARESDDVLAAIDYVKTLKTDKGQPLVADRFGLYGVELGAYAAIKAALHDTRVRVLVLDSVPRSPDDVLRAAVSGDIGLDNRPLQFFARVATRIYFMGSYDNTPSCEMAASLKSQRALLLSGDDAGYLRDSTSDVARCFPNQANLEVKTDLPLTGFRQPFAPPLPGEGYDQLVIDFLYKNLVPSP